MIVNYYSINSAYNNANANSLAVNNAVKNASAPYDVTIADAYALFAKASQNAPGNDTCAAGLLTLPPVGTRRAASTRATPARQCIATAAERVITKS